jgi:methionyl-tRNA formyltransferase
MAALRLAFFGTPDFAVPSLAALLGAGHDVARIYSQPPRPAGRGHKPRPSPVQAFAEGHGIEARTPARLDDLEERAAFAALAPDAGIVVAYGLILPKAILDVPRLGCVNVHASLLPRWRGAAPIQRAIMAGDAETGITIMRMDEGLDTGPVLLREAIGIAPDETAGSLHDRLAALGATLLVTALAGLATGEIAAVPQDEVGASYARKMARGEARLDWRRTAAELARHVRASAPAPGAWFEHDGERVKVLECVAAPGGGQPGTALDDHLTIACGAGTVRQ